MWVKTRAVGGGRGMHQSGFFPAFWFLQDFAFLRKPRPGYRRIRVFLRVKKPFSGRPRFFTAIRKDFTRKNTKNRFFPPTKISIRITLSVSNIQIFGSSPRG
jgi:hypothetical protein